MWDSRPRLTCVHTLYLLVVVAGEVGPIDPATRVSLALFIILLSRFISVLIEAYYWISPFASASSNGPYTS